MILVILRALFVLLAAGIGWKYVQDKTQFWGDQTRFLTMGVALVTSLLVLAGDYFAPRRKLQLFSGTFLGLLVGIVMAFALSFVVQLLVQQFIPISAQVDAQSINEARTSLTSFLTLLVGSITCYLAISFILQTKDDFRFVIPYVEFRKQTKGNRPLLVDTSVLIDGRINAILSAGIFESQLIVPQFVLQELHAVADSADRLKRNRGRRGIEVLGKLQKNPRVEVVNFDTSDRHDETSGVDQRLMRLAKELDARVLTTDFNLDKIARLAGIDVININELASAMKPEMLPGEKISIKVIKAGESAGQGVGYLDDGTMVVVEQGRTMINQEIEIVVTNSVQTAAGKMIFGRLADAPDSTPVPHRPARNARA